MLNKKCSVCKVNKDIGLFYTSKHGYINKCKVCHNDASAKWVQNNKDRKREIARNWVKRNKEKARENSNSWFMENKERHKEVCTRWVVNNRAKVNHLAGKRRAAKLRAMPKWLTEEQLNEIKVIYIEAKRLESLDYIPRHVDHIIPLQGKDICGLHVPWNLQILTAEENRKKHNSIICEMVNINI
jgi:uncharacterized Zn finger protein (UPF0148 family)